MTVAALLRAANKAGLRVVAAGDRLKLSASSKPSEELLRLIDARKHELLRVQQPDERGWTGSDWVALFDARVAAHAGEPNAESKAFEHCVREWRENLSTPSDQRAAGAVYLSELGLSVSVGTIEPPPPGPRVDRLNAPAKQLERATPQGGRPVDDIFALIIRFAQHELHAGFTIEEMGHRVRHPRIASRIATMVDDGILVDLGHGRYRCAPRFQRQRRNFR